jgi:hypothetical protein
MPGCARHPDPRVTALAAVLALGLCSACGAPGEDARFEIRQVDAAWSSGRLQARIEQRVGLSEEARAALQHGVPLTVAVELILRDGQSRSRLHEFERRYEIRYLPLSQRYQLSGDDAAPAQSYPRLRHALAELGRLELIFETGALPGGEYELLARSYLDQQRLPAPMRLPALFSPSWDHASGWTAWRLSVTPGA